MLPVDFRAYWEQRTSSEHRSDDDAWYRSKAEEHLGLMSDEDRRSGCVDLGCGAGELLVHLSRGCRVDAALDFSSAMLDRARQRFPTGDVQLLNEDVFSYLGHAVARVWLASGSVNQYLDGQGQERMLDQFRENGAARSFYLFDCIDPSRYVLFERRALNRYDASAPAPWLHRVAGFFRGMMRAAVRPAWFEAGALGHLGFGFAPCFWRRACERRHLRLELVSSRFYEYRYHAIIRK